MVAAIIENEYQEILCTLRSPQICLTNLWEFPGGKVEKGESIEYALKREILEELDCTIEAGEVFHNNTHEYENSIVNLICIKYKIVEGAPTSNEYSELIWFRRDNLDSLKWAPADIPALKMLINE